MGTQAAGNAQVDSRSRAPEEVVRAVDAALDAARALAERSRMPFDGDLDSLALLSGCDLDDELDRESCAAVAAVLSWIETTRAAAAR
jgi:hypothetical protein